MCERIALLTPRELEVLTLVAQGKTNKEIAALLCIVDTTAQLHVGHILNKLGVGNRVEASICYWRCQPEIDGINY